MKNLKNPVTMRAGRLRVMRSMLGLTRREAADLCKVGRSTFQYWEEGKGNGISEKGAEKVIQAFQTSGLYCELNWLLHDVGNPPQLGIFETGGITKPHYVAEQENQYILKEVLLFRSHCPDVIDYQVIDLGMSPQYEVGDYVAGRRYYGKEIEKYLNKICIVELKNNKQILRYLKPGSEPGLYTLLCTNYSAALEDIALVNVQLKSAAPIIWHRKAL